MHTINYHCSSIIRCNDFSESLLTSCVPVNNIVLEYMTKSTNQIWSLIFIPSMSTVCILKSIPFELEREREREREREEERERERERERFSKFWKSFTLSQEEVCLWQSTCFWPQPFRHSFNISLPVWLYTTLFYIHLCICTILRVAWHYVKSSWARQSGLENRNWGLKNLLMAKLSLPASKLSCVYHIALFKHFVCVCEWCCTSIHVTCCILALANCF